jgi:hypothetical protein
MPGDPQECRENARRCVAMAQTSRSQLGKQKFEDLAQNWLALASHYKAANFLLAAWADLPAERGTSFCCETESDQTV